MRVLADASVLLRFPLLSRNPSRAVEVIVEAAFAGNFDLLLPDDLLAEIADKLATDPYISARVSPRRVRLLTVLLRRVAVSLQPCIGSFPARTRDPKDDYLLAYAIRDRAGFLATSDRDLLDLASEFASPRIVDPGAFVWELRNRGPIDG